MNKDHILLMVTKQNSVLLYAKSYTKTKGMARLNYSQEENVTLSPRNFL